VNRPEPIPEPHYLIPLEHTRVVAAAVQLLFKILGSGLPGLKQREVIARLGVSMMSLPGPIEPCSAIVTLTSPRKWFGPHEIYHWWTNDIEGDVITISSGGHFYRESTGGDTFELLHWSAAPGMMATLDDLLDQNSIVDDAAPFPEEVRRIRIADGGYSLEVVLDGEDVDGEPRESDDSEGCAERPERVAQHPDPKLEISERLLAATADLATGLKLGDCHASPPDACDICGRHLDQATMMVDGVRKDTGEWACLCAVCFADVGSGVRYGQGQLYQRQSSGNWLLVGGFPPEDNAEE
jgi:hypothetical protein